MSSPFHIPDSDASRTTAATLPLTPAVDAYLEHVARLRERQQETGQPMIEVNESLGMLAFAYEKVRNSVDYREDHVLLRSAIIRILKRRLHPFWQYDSAASALLRELIWARYLANDAVPATTVTEVEAALKRYFILRDGVAQLPAKEGWGDWTLSIVACDIERILTPADARLALAELMYTWVEGVLTVDGLDPDERAVQLYIAVHRGLLKSDRTALTHALFQFQVPSWATMADDDVRTLIADLPTIRQTITTQLTHRQGHILHRTAKRLAPPFIVLEDIVKSKGALAPGVLREGTGFAKAIRETCAKFYGQIQGRIRRALIRSIIYIFATKMILAFILEIPYDRFVYGEIHWWTLGANVLTPPLLMILIGLTIHAPSDRNTAAISGRLERLVYGPWQAERLVAEERKSTLSPTLTVLYILTTVAIFGGLGYGLYRASFSPLGIGLFLFFTCVVVFFAYRVRRIAEELTVVREREGFFASLLTFITLPFVRMGYRLSASFGRMNVFVFILDVLLEAPFKLILDVSEQWLTFLRQKRDEIMDVPAE